VKYALASITKSCTNLGNLLIEYNALELLKKNGFGEPTFVFDAFEDPDQEIIAKINELDSVIVPGCTTLTAKYYPKIQDVLPQTKVPVVNIGAAFGSKYDDESIEFAKYYHQPVGTRDPISNEVLSRAGYQTEFIGCPTLFSSNATKFNYNHSGKISFGLGIENIDEQLKLIDEAIKVGYKVNVIIQVEEQRDLVADKDVTIIEYEPKGVIEEVGSSDFVVTGRLHVALPSIATGTPVLFVKTIEDTRFSLLEYLHIEMFKPNELKSIDLNNIRTRLVRNEKMVYDRVRELRSRYQAYLDRLARNFS